MHIMDKDHAIELDSGHGEIIYELIGCAVGEPTERHSVAHVVVLPGKSSLAHHHPIAEESYYILQGRAYVEVGDQHAVVEPGQIVLIPPMTRHKVSNPGAQDLEFLAFCVPAWEPGNTIYESEPA